MSTELNVCAGVWGALSAIEHIGGRDIAAAMSVRDFLDSCDEAFRLFGLGKMRNPARDEAIRREGAADRLRLVLPILSA